MTDFNVTLGGDGLTVQLGPEVDLISNVQLSDVNGVLEITITTESGRVFTAETRVGIATGGIPRVALIDQELILTYDSAELEDTGYTVRGEQDIEASDATPHIDAEGSATYPLLANDILTIGGETFTVREKLVSDSTRAESEIQVDQRAHVHLTDGSAIQVNFQRLAITLTNLGGVVTDSSLSGNGADVVLSIASGGVTTGKIRDGAVTYDKTASDVASLLLPPLPNPGSRDNKSPKFSGDDLQWQEDAGGVSQADFDAEKATRESGDMLTAIQVSTEAALTSALTSQMTSDEALRIHFTAEVVHSGTTYAKDQISYVPPRSNAIENEFILPQPGQGGGTVADGSITTEKLANEAVTTRKLAGQSVTSGKLVNSPIIDTTRLFNNSVTRDKIPANTIIQGHMEDNAIGTPELIDDNVTEAKLSADVRAKLNAHPTGDATDQTARDAAAAANCCTSWKQ